MLLAIDIGNSNICLAVFDKSGEIVCTFRMATDTKKTPDQYFVEFANFLSLTKNLDLALIKQIAISSVVPDLELVFTVFSRVFFSIDPLFLTSGNIPLKINLYNPSEVGSDRLVDALAALEVTKSNIIIIDFGTATTINLVTQDRCYQGGMIFPGINLMINSLKSGTAKLPRISFTKATSPVGKSTVEAISAGLFFGYVDFISGAIKRIESDLNAKPFIIATGGLSTVITGEITDIIDLIDPNLTMKGIFLATKSLSTDTKVS